jgi:hypothetical protein
MNAYVHVMSEENTFWSPGVAKDCELHCYGYISIRGTVFRLHTHTRSSVIQGDSKLLSGYPSPINENTDNNLESLCIMRTALVIVVKVVGS